MRLQTNTKTLEDLCSQSMETASPAIHDAATTHQSVFSLCYLFRNPFSSTTIRDENHIPTLGDYSKLSHEGYKNTIELPEGNNVVPLQSDTIRLVQNGCSFHGLRSEDPNQHLKDFLKLDPSPHGRILLPDSLLNSFHRERPQNSATISRCSNNIMENLYLKHGLALLEDLALYDNKSWNDPRDFAKLVTAIALPQDVLSISDRRLIELENQVECLMEAYLASTQLTQVNKITTSCEIYNGPHDTHNCTEGPEQACVNYASSYTKKIRDKKFISNQGPRNFNDAANTWKDKLNFNWERTQTFTNLQNESISVHSSSYQIKLERALLDFDSNQEKSHDEKEELRKKGIKIPSKFFSPKYLSPASIKELNKNLSAPKHIHFINSTIILSINSDTKEEDTSFTNAHNHELDAMERISEGIKEHSKEDDEIETDMEVEEVIEEEQSEFETDEEVEEVFEEEEEDEDDESFNSFLTMKELSHHKWLLKHPRPP
ncbi:hypothetical protein Tco_0856632 [Tanacetum coccineum]|uniref:MAK10-like protein n=1 Tax=Tanacetum coccineum TaxID=301880 RepID=A0ABQ5B412_9ASTR